MLTADGLWDFVTGPATLIVLAATLILAWPLGHRLAALLPCPRWAAVPFVIVVGVILALTLTPNMPAGPGQPAPPPHFVTLRGQPTLLWAQLTVAPRDHEQLANIALYVPLGLVGRSVWRGALRSASFGLALTAGIELCQYGIVGRAGSLTDIRNNATGAVLGAALAAVTALAARRAAAGRRGHRPASTPGGRTRTARR